MAGGKKKKKPASNPARGFATTSVASKPKVEVAEPETSSEQGTVETQQQEHILAAASQVKERIAPEKSLTAEEFEKQLEESELQIIVEKHAQKSKRDAIRQKTRLETDRRVLRGQAESLSTRKWLPPELMEEILDLVNAEGRFAGQSNDSSNSTKQVSEEELTIRLWTLQQALVGAGFIEEKVSRAIRHVLDMSDKIGGACKDSIWGMEESLEWLARECSRDELPDYENLQRKTLGLSKSQTETPNVSPQASGATTPRVESDNRHMVSNSGALRLENLRPPIKKLATLDYDSDIDPDDLLPAYLECKTKLFLSQNSTPKKEHSRGPLRNKPASVSGKAGSLDPQPAKLLRKIKKIEDDILFDKYLAGQQWDAKRIELEKEAACFRRLEENCQDSGDSNSQNSQTLVDSDDEVSKEAAKIGAAMLQESGSDDDDALADLFASLPVNEVDPLTGKSSTVVNGPNGVKVTIREFGKWSGINPTRVLEEACRARESSVKLNFTLISDSSFSNRHSLRITWSKAQDFPVITPPTSIDYTSSPKSQTLTMVSVSTPDPKQSEAFVATVALFLLFSSSTKEDKVFLRLPPAWRDLWTEFAEAKKEKADEADRSNIRVFRDMVREKRDQELEDGVLIQGAFRNRHASRAPEHADEAGSDKSNKCVFEPEAYQRIWFEKSNTQSYQTMLNSRMQLPMWGFKTEVLAAIDREQVVIICGETGCGKSTQETRLIYATTGILMRMLEGSNDLKDITHIVLDEVHERTIDSDFLLIVLRKLIARRRDLKVVLMSATVDADRFSKYLDGAPVLTVPGRTFPVTVKYLEDVVEVTGYTLDNTYHEKFTDLDDDELEVGEAGLTEANKIENTKALRGYSGRTKNTISQLDEYQIDFELVTQLLAKIALDDKLQIFSKAILVFLPGIGEIRQLNDMLLGHPVFSADWYVYPLHSTIASEDQEAAFLVPPSGTRKIVLATNIAETGITIPDVTCVVDTGKHREMRFDERKQLSRLLETFISKANAKQRRGRAGRVQEGLCFHLFTKHRHDELMADQQTPELLRLSLQDLAIRVKICKLGGIEETLCQALDPPSSKNIRRAVDALIDVRALTPGEDLTPLGIQLARLPLDVFLGKLVLLGSIFKCLDAAITIAAILSSKSPFSAPFGARAQADTVRLAFRRGDSDLLTIYNAYMAWKRVCVTGNNEYQFCRKNFLSQQTLLNIEDLKGQLVVCLVDSGFLPLTGEERSALNRRVTQS
ncbi:hypothetical protein B2J93_6276 [Marssonina coronariae]|uniref:Uncharacterized protein n=1 Tax=Diplocarpon coronariae TaxID=2795749 RepID=A0A218ZDZ0_9HELO|nr:hypothetical protein B2J93_6276 [Marssonina coronariae]